MINFMDLSRQCSQLKKEMMAAIEKVYDETAFVGSHFVDVFESNFSKYIGTTHAVSVSNGTDALFLACKSLKIGPGDEVLVPANTFIASAWAPMHCGAKVIFVDCNEDDWLINLDDVQEKITNKTKAVIGVHLYGQPFDASRLKDICVDKSIHMIEDCAQAHGAKWDSKTVGTFGDVGCFSFYPGKNLGAYGDAGAITTNNDNYAHLINMLKDHGSEQKYHHELPGYNMRMDGFQAAILDIKLKYIDSWNERRKEISLIYFKGINNEKITLQNPNKKSEGVHHLFVVLVDDRQKFLDHMNHYGINCGIHYPIPCHKQGAFLNIGCSQKLPVSEYVAEHCVSLPMYPELTDEEVNEVIRAVNEYE